jgi:sporulation protein YlmC with PRC-barrel domain
MEARHLYAGLHLLDRQILDREGRYCGKVDDVELERDEATGSLFVTAIVSGPGALAYRTGHHRLGRWLQRVNAFVFPPPDGDEDEDHDPTTIAFGRIADIGHHVTFAGDHSETAGFSVERWVRDHLIGPIPGSGDAPQ